MTADLLPPDPLRRTSRLAAVRATGLLDGAESPVLDRLTRLATRRPLRHRLHTTLVDLRTDRHA